MSGSFASSGLFSLNMSETEKAVDVTIDPAASYGCESCDQSCDLSCDVLIIRNKIFSIYSKLKSIYKAVKLHAYIVYACTGKKVDRNLHVHYVIEYIYMCTRKKSDIKNRLKYMHVHIMYINALHYIEHACIHTCTYTYNNIIFLHVRV